MFRTLDDFSFHQTVGEMGVAVSANAIGRVKDPVGIAIEREGFVAVIEANHIGGSEVGGGTDFESAPLSTVCFGRSGN